MLSAASPSWLSNVSQVEVLITRACNPTMGEPNYALHLEVAEFINQKKANTPREAAMTIARLVNHRNPHVAMLALALLETLVQSCGYPFHLQIATKEFLNELVRRFPERPPPFPGPVMQKILDLIHNWKETICVESRWKDDFSNIRDMHRLLTFKGYRFRDVPRQSAGPSVASNIKSAEELEAEDREAQSAKLQELIRRGTPRDLAAAQELMKTLAGANPDAKPDYRTQALTELNKLESKVILLNEILDNVDTTKGEKFVQGDVYDQVASILRDARPKIQKWISNAETDDPESLDTYLQINDQINTVLNRYESYKKGDYTAAANPIPPELSNGAGPSGSQSVSLIDFDDAPSQSQSAAPVGSAGGIDELASLFGPSTTAPVQSTSPIPVTSPAPAPNILSNFSNLGYGQPANTGLGMGMGFGGMGMSGQPQQTQTPPTYQAPTPMAHNSMGMGGQPRRAGTVSPSSGAPLGSIRLGTPSTPSHPPPQPQSPGYFGQPMQPMQPQQQQQQQFQPTQPTNGQAQAQGKDPFADLVGLF
ncbi:VHS domain-containing protein [Cerioporus squamosus]|nr:VHS domain-containing protein [Cerioporus squamosus]